MAGIKNLSSQQKTQIMQKLLTKLNKKGKPILGTINEIANGFLFFNHRIEILVISKNLFSIPDLNWQIRIVLCMLSHQEVGMYWQDRLA